MTFSDAFWNARIYILIHISPKFVSKSSVYNKSHCRYGQRCVVRGITLSSLLSCRLLPNRTRAAHLWCSPRPTCADPEAEASTGQFTRVWSGSRVLRGWATQSIVSDVSPGHAGRRAWTRASESLQPAAQTSCPEPARRVSFAWVRR